MPFEPLNTDEKLDAAGPRERSMDDLMLAGCSSFVAASLICYGLGVWPFLLYADSSELHDLLAAVALGLVPSMVFGLIMSKRGGLPGACGFVGGAMAVAVFLYLNIKRLMLTVAVAQGAKQDFPPALVYLLPLFWLLVALAIAIVAVPKSDLPGRND